MKFSKQYEKLSDTVFTTIRKNNGFYNLWRTYSITTPQNKFRATIIGLTPIKKLDIFNALSLYDAECDKYSLCDMLEKWYGKKHDDYVLITMIKA